MRKATRFTGVQSRESSTKKHNGRPDVCFTIDYIDSTTKKRVRKDIGWSSQGITAAYASQIRAESILKSQTQTLVVMNELSLEQAFDKYVEDWLIARNKSPDTDTYLFNKNLKKYGHILLKDIDVLLLDKMIAEFTARNLSKRTVRYLISIIQRVMRKMVAWNLFKGELPFDRLILPKLNNARQRFLTPDEANALLQALKLSSTTLYLQSLISLHCGLRFGEIANLTISDIDFFSNNIYVSDPKNGKSRNQIMTQTVSEELTKHISNMKSQVLLFPARTGEAQKSVSSTFERTIAKLKLNEKNGVKITDARQKVVFHTLRHTYASWLAMSGQGQAIIADLLGHSSIQMSARYTHLFPDTRRDTANIIDNIFKKS